MRKPTTLTAAAMAMTALLGAQEARAQSGDFSFGWSISKSYELEETFPAGFHLGAAGRFTDHFGVAADLGWNQKGDEVQNIVSADVTLTTFSAGPRVYFGSSRVTGFGHVLFGVARGTLTLAVLGSEERETTTEFLVQPGAGLDFGVSRGFAIRIQGDYQLVSDIDGNFRFVLAGVLRFGGS
ncbi:MAG: outer membrane beta-barrel protein [Vicinamibacteria bacterium]